MDRVLVMCPECGPELSVQVDDDCIPTNGILWAELVENLTGDTVPVEHDLLHVFKPVKVVL